MCYNLINAYFWKPESAMRMMKVGAVLSVLLMAVSCGDAVLSESSPEEFGLADELQALLNSETSWSLRYNASRDAHVAVQPLEGRLLELEVLEVRGMSLRPEDEILLTPRGLERFRARGSDGVSAELPREDVARTLASQETISQCGNRKMTILARGSLRSGPEVELILGANLYEDRPLAAQVLDGGTDGGVDAGGDAGIDAGGDAGIDAGVMDAGTDAGTDGGTECRKVDGGCSGWCPDVTYHYDGGDFRYNQACTPVSTGWFSSTCECKPNGPVHG